MKKELKIFLIVVIVLFGIILLDTVQALVFNNNPIIGIQTKCRSKQGLLVTTYHCGNGKNITKWKSSSCNIENICDITHEELEFIHNTINNKLEEYEKINGKKYTNVSSIGVDSNLNNVVITLVDNSEIEQKRFRTIIYDSPYITFRQGGPYTTSESELSLIIKPGTLTNNGATFILKNMSTIDYNYEQAYYIEKKENNNWKEIELTEPLSWNTVLYTLKASQEVEITINWGNTGYGTLKNGKYRLVKNNFRKNNNPDSKSYSVYAEFEIPIKVIAGTANTIQVEKNNLQDGNKFNLYLKRDGKKVFIASNIKEVYYDNVKTKYVLKDYIQNTWQNIDDSLKHLINYMTLFSELNDGGTRIYKSQEYDITIVMCNTLIGNKDYYIGDYNLLFDSNLMCK